MSVNTESIIHHIMERISEIGYVKPEDIPNIDLYMDQVTTFMEAQLAHSKRYKDDKILTKTMINNYAKNNLLPSPEKKRYSKEHLLVLIFIYYFKNILSINDIQTLLGPLTDKYFKSDENIDLTSIYTAWKRARLRRSGKSFWNVTRSHRVLLRMHRKKIGIFSSYFPLSVS